MKTVTALPVGSAIGLGAACVECGGELILTTAREVGMSPGYGTVYACADGCGRVTPVPGGGGKR